MQFSCMHVLFKLRYQESNGCQISPEIPIAFVAYVGVEIADVADTIIKSKSKLAWFIIGIYIFVLQS